MSWLGDLRTEECVFSKHLVHSRWQPQLPFSLQFRLHFPSLRSPLLLTWVSAFGDGEAVGTPQSRLCLVRLGAQIVDSLQRREDLEPRLPLQESTVPPSSHVSLFGGTGQPRGLRRTGELVPGPGLTFPEQLLGTRHYAGCQGHGQKVQPCPLGAPSLVGNQGTWGRDGGALITSALGLAGFWRLRSSQKSKIWIGFLCKETSLCKGTEA